MIVRLVAAALVSLLAVPAAAENRALVIGNHDYDAADPVEAAADVDLAADALEAAGFSVVLGMDLGAGNLRAGLDRLLDDPHPERVVILLTGHFVSSSGSTWLLGIDAEEPTLATVDGDALSVSTVMEVAALSPGGALVLLGSEPAELPLGRGLVAGIGPLEVPQGVTVLTGEAAEIVAFAETGLMARGASLPELLEDWPQLEVQGFLSRLVPFLPAAAQAPPVVEEISAAERALWQAVRDRDTVTAYQTYLNRFPQGRYAGEARRAIERLNRAPERVEEALALTATQRRQIQRHLNLLGFDTRGVDGIFGPGTRTAISAWQRGRGLATSGFLTADQIDMLARDAAQRQAEIEEEERRQQAEAERADREFWREVGQGRDEASLRRYLQRYPEGLFSAVARERLNELVAQRDQADWDRARRADTAEAYRRYMTDHPQGRYIDEARARLEERRQADLDARDRAAWDTATAADTVQAYRQYLQEFPQGRYANRARELIAQAEGPSDQVVAARRAEEALNLSPFAIRLVESQLQRAGFNPGAVDGRLDENSRRAIRQYQRNAGLPVTGYLSQQMLVRLAAEGLQLLPQ